MRPADFQPSWQTSEHEERRHQFSAHLQRHLTVHTLTYASEEGQQLLSWAWQLGDLEGCIQLAERWLAAAQLSEVEGVSLETRIAACLIRLGKLSDAEARLSRVLNEHLANDFDAPDNLGYAYLQLGNARRYLGNADDARTAFDSSLEQAEATRDGGLAIASHTALGELSLDETALEQAIGSLGKGLGLTEFFRDERLTIAPLAALAHAHALWKNPSKSYDLVNRALARARPSVDRVGSARAKLASATAALSRAPKAPNTAYSFAAAYEDARVAPHVPLALRIATSDLEQRARGVLIDAENVVKDAQHVLQQLNTCGMMPQVRQLKALIDNLNS